MQSSTVQRILATDDERHLTVMRIVLGLTILAHGTQKLFGWFGGQGFEATVAGFSGHMGIPAPLGVLVILTECLGGLALVLGLLGRVAAFGVFMIMLGAALKVHLPNGFFMNWTGQKPGEGFEFHVLAGTLALAIMLAGSGAHSFDLALSRRRGLVPEPYGSRVAPAPDQPAGAHT